MGGFSVRAAVCALAYLSVVCWLVRPQYNEKILKRTFVNSLHPPPLSPGQVYEYQFTFYVLSIDGKRLTENGRRVDRNARIDRVQQLFIRKQALKVMPCVALECFLAIMRVVRLVVLVATAVARRSLLVFERGNADGDERRSRRRFQHFDSSEGSNRTPAELTAAKFVQMLGEKSEDGHTINAQSELMRKGFDFSVQPGSGKQGHSVGRSKVFLVYRSRIHDAKTRGAWGSISPAFRLSPVTSSPAFR